MRMKFYLPHFIFSLFFFIHTGSLFSQCLPVTATYIVVESRCAATGSIEINATGGSGNYLYKVSGPQVTNFSSVNIITGLPAGNYQVIIQDVVTGCTYQNDIVTVPGNYATPGFTMLATDASSCPAANDGTITVTSEAGGRAPFSYKIVAPSPSNVGVTSVTGSFTGLSAGNYFIQLSDSCGAIQTRSINVGAYNWKIESSSIIVICNDISVVLTLSDSRGNFTPSPAFDGFMYGISIAPGDTTWFTSNSFIFHLGNLRAVTIVVKDPCGNTDRIRWTNPNIPALNPLATTTNLGCTGFTAFVTGQVNLQFAQYCLYNSNNVLQSCNSTGVFSNIPYGSYCIRITDTCYDTTMIRCFVVPRPIPAVAALVQVTSNCTSAIAAITGQLNLNNPNYCLYDNNNVLVSCNSTGIFSNITFGTYCIKITNDPSCYDTIITRCFTAAPPVAGTIVITNQTCNSFTATVLGVINVVSPQYCLYNSANVLIACNSTGVFDNIPLGTYCIQFISNIGCGEVLTTSCFTVILPVPAVNNVVDISNKACSTFTATITGQTGLINPQYCLYNSSNILVSCNSIGIFTDVPYGSYCIKIQNDPACFDTVITRCFTVANPNVPIAFTASSVKSCTLIGGTDITVNITAGLPSFTIEIFHPSGALVQSAVTTTVPSSHIFIGVPGLPTASLQYKIVVTGLCGRDSLFITPVISIVERRITITPKCPSSLWPNGSADVIIDISNNNIGGNIKPKVIKVNGVNNNINPSSNVGYVYTFSDLGPGVYIFDTKISNCSNKDVFDTVTVGSYSFPDLSQSAGYICDNTGYSISAAITGGVPPISYEIIGSTPSTPSIIAGPQSNPVFTINNGTSYSLVRLRAIDGCSNAALNDVGIQPLSSVGISAGFDCFYVGLTLTADSIPNSTYKWYKKNSATDSVLVGTTSSYTMPFLMPTDTGRYECIISVNNGCLTRIAFYNVTGSCNGGILAVTAELSGRMKNDHEVSLNWMAEHEANVNTYIIERSTGSNNEFIPIGSLGKNNNSNGTYVFSDTHPFSGNNYYRLKIKGADDTRYSNTVLINNNSASLSIMPNPVTDHLVISIRNTYIADYNVRVTDLSGKVLFTKMYNDVQSEDLLIYRNQLNIAPGLYILTLNDRRSGKTHSQKLVFR